MTDDLACSGCGGPIVLTGGDDGHVTATATLDGTGRVLSQLAFCRTCAPRYVPPTGERYSIAATPSRADQTATAGSEEVRRLLAAAFSRYIASCVTTYDVADDLAAVALNALQGINYAD